MSISPRGGLPTRWGALVHVLLVILGWVLFFVFWRFVAQRPWDSRDLTVLIVVALAVLPLITLLWIRHNLSIHRRLGPRRTTRAVDEHYTHDFNRRVVRADWAALREASEVVIDIQGEHKMYRRGFAAAAPLPEPFATDHALLPKPVAAEAPP